jgi:hypothetical protein
VRFVVRSWIRQALRASGVAILVPAAVAAAIALSVLGGGRNTGSLGEVLRGPAVPPAEAATPPVRLRGQSPHSHLGRRGHEMRLRGQSPQSHAVPPAARAPSQRSPAPRPPAPAPVSAPAPPPPPAPAAPPPPVPHPIHDAGTQVAETLRPLPIAGPVAADAVQAVVSLVDPA